MSAVWDAFVARALVKRGLFVQFRGMIKSVMFKDTVLGQLYDLLCSFFDEYRKLPTKDEFLVRLSKLPSSERERMEQYVGKLKVLYDSPPEFGDDVLSGEVVEGIRRHMIEEMLLDGAGMVDSGRVDYEKLLAQMKDVISVKVDSDLGIEVGADPAMVIQEITAEDRFEIISTGIEGLDRVLRGGWYKGQFACGIAPSGVGKSTFLVNHAVGGLTQGKNVVLLTCELQDVMVVERVVRRVVKMKRGEIIKEPAEAGQRLGRFFKLSGSRLFVRYARPGQFTVLDLEGYLDRLEMLADFKVDLVVVDYLDEMKANSVDIRRELRHQHHGIARDFTSLAKDRDVAVVTETQTNREALGKKRLSERDVGEDYGKVKVADIVYAVCMTDAESEAGQARVRMLKIRDGPGKGREIPVRVDYERMTVASLEPRTFKEEDVTW